MAETLSSSRNARPGQGAVAVLRVEDLRVQYGAICALREVSFVQQGGAALALMGRNGAGKSTLLKALAGLQPCVAGRMFWRSEPLAAIRSEIAYLPQREEVDWNFPVTVRGLVEMGRYSHLGLWRRFGRHDREVVDLALEAMEMGALAQRQIRQLSGGQQQRAFIARALAQEAEVLLLDEPFGGLDKPAMALLSRLLRRLTGEGRLIIASHHDLNTAGEAFDQVLLLNGGVVAHGPVADVITSENIRRAYAP